MQPSLQYILHFHHPPNPLAISPHPPPQATSNPLSAPVDEPVLGSSQKWNHTPRGLLSASPRRTWLALWCGSGAAGEHEPGLACWVQPPERPWEQGTEGAAGIMGSLCPTPGSSSLRLGLPTQASCPGGRRHCNKHVTLTGVSL